MVKLEVEDVIQSAVSKTQMACFSLSYQMN